MNPYFQSEKSLDFFQSVAIVLGKRPKVLEGMYTVLALAEKNL